MAGEFARQVGPSVGQSLGLLGRDAIREWRAANRFGVGFGRHQVGPLTGKDPPRAYAANRKQGLNPWPPTMSFENCWLMTLVLTPSLKQKFSISIS